MDRPRASVIIPAWNTCDLLARCLDSVVAQKVAGGFDVWNQANMHRYSDTTRSARVASSELMFLPHH